MKASALGHRGADRAPALGLRAARPLGAPATLSRLLPWAALGAVLGLALFLRLYNLTGFITYYPDTYGQLRAVDNVLSGTLPISYLYPPGIALVLAPVFAVLPDTMLVLQSSIIAAGIALVGVAYYVAWRASNERRAAVFAAAGVAIGATFVFHTRMALFDVISTLLVVAALLLAPLAFRRGPAAHVAYGLLLFLTVTARYTNAVVLAPAFFYALLAQGGRTGLRDTLALLRSRAVLTAGATLLALYAAYVGTSTGSFTRYGNSDAGSIFDFSSYVPRLGQYLQATLIGYGDELLPEDAVAMMVVLALAVVGARHVWRTDRALLPPVALLLVLWAPVLAVYEVFAGRYAMPAFFFVVVLAAIGLSRALDWQGGFAQPWQRVAAAGLLAFSVGLAGGRQLALDTVFIRQWPGDVETGREAAYDAVRAELALVDGKDALLVSSQALAVDRANEEIVTLDLLTHSERYGINEASIERVIASVRERIAAGEAVYYHYTEYEDVQSRFRKYELGFDAYYWGLRRAFALRELVSAEERPQRLYLVEPRSP